MATEPRRVLFLTGTRADFGKLKPLMRAVDADLRDFSAFLAEPRTWGVQFKALF